VRTGTLKRFCPQSPTWTWGQGFSRAGLIDQLDSPYGGKFTYAQAVYAANQVGL
jgi:hypothetical protein